MNPDSTFAIHHFMPGEGFGGRAGIDLPLWPKIAPMAGAEKASVDHIQQAT